LIQYGSSFFAAVIPVRNRGRTSAVEDILEAGALVVVDGVRPRVSERSFEAARHPFAKLCDQRVVVAVAARVDQVYPIPIGVDAVCPQIGWCGVRADLSAVIVGNAKSDGRSSRTDIEVLHCGQMQSPAPQVGDG